MKSTLIQYVLYFIALIILAIPVDVYKRQPQENAKITLDILKGQKGPQRDAVLMNAGAAIYIGGKAQDLQEGIAIARQMIDEGKALKKLEDFIQASQVEV